MFFVSSHTLSPFLNGINMSFLLLAMHLLASSCAARASSRSAKRCFIFSSIVGNLVCLKEVGIVIGELPNMSLKGVFCQSACLLLLWVNSSMVRDFVHVSG